MSLKNESKFVNHYTHKCMNGYGIDMCDRFERRLHSFIESSIRGVKIKEVRLVVMITGRHDAHKRDGVLASLAIKYGRRSISIDVRALFDIDDRGQQTFRYVMENVNLST